MKCLENCTLGVRTKKSCARSNTESNFSRLFRREDYESEIWNLQVQSLIASFLINSSYTNGSKLVAMEKAKQILLRQNFLILITPYDVYRHF